jgi:two-component system OmpR family sensor kinase
MRNWLYVVQRRPEQAAAAAARLDAEIVALEGRLEQMMALPVALRPPRTRPVEMDELARQVIAALGDDASRVQAELDAGDAPVNADPQQLGLAVRALLLRALARGTPGAQVSCRTGQSGPGVTLSVEDQGPGGPAELEEALDPFGAPANEGLSLHLGTAYVVARAHGAELGIESEPGRGTRVTLGPLPWAVR